MGAIENKTNGGIQMTDIKWYATEIEKMDMTVCLDDAVQFQNTLERYLNNIDPDNEHTIAEAVERMSVVRAKQLYERLLQYSYDEDL